MTRFSTARSMSWANLCIIGATLINVALCNCYYSNGSLTPTVKYLKCTNTPTCCALNRTNPPGGDLIDGPTIDDCLPNGMCQNRITKDGTKQQRYWRSPCANSDWTNGNCLNICTDAVSCHNEHCSSTSVPCVCSVLASNYTKDTEITFGSVEMTPCDGTNLSSSWCCGKTTGCCSSSENRWIIPSNFGAPASSTLSPSMITANPKTLSSTSAATEALASSTSISQMNARTLSASEKTGIGLGATIGMLFVFALGFSLAQGKKKAKMAKTDYESSRVMEQHSNSCGFLHQSIEAGGCSIQEAAATSTKVIMPELAERGVVVKHELP